MVTVSKNAQLCLYLVLRDSTIRCVSLGLMGRVESTGEVMMCALNKHLPKEKVVVLGTLVLAVVIKALSTAEAGANTGQIQN